MNYVTSASHGHCRLGEIHSDVDCHLCGICRLDDDMSGREKSSEMFLLQITVKDVSDTTFVGLSLDELPLKWKAIAC